MKRKLSALVAAVVVMFVLPSVALASSDTWANEEAIASGKAFASGEIILTNQSWNCVGAVAMDLVKVTITSNTSLDAISLGTNCTGSVARVEVVTNGADGIKIQNASPNAAHDLVIGGGYVHATGAAPGAHQDCIQAMGGARILFRNLVLDCTGGGGGNLFINWRSAGAGARVADVVCEHCAVGPNHNNPNGHVRINDSLRSGIRDSLICQGSDSTPIALPGDADQPITTPNEIVPNSDPRCTLEGLQEWAGGGAPPPPPPPPPPVPPALSKCGETTQLLSLCWQPLSPVQRFNYYRGAMFLAHTLNGSTVKVRFGKVVGTHDYCVEAVYTDARAARSCVSATR